MAGPTGDAEGQSFGRADGRCGGQAPTTRPGGCMRELQKYRDLQVSGGIGLSSKERVLTALRCQKPDRVPFMELGIDYVVGQRLLKKEQYHPGELAEFLCLDGIGTGLYPVIYVQRRTDETGRSFIVGGLIRDRSDLSMIDPGDSTDESRYDQVKQFVDKHGDKYAIFAATNIGLDPLLLSMGPENFAYALADDIRLVEEILDIYTEWSAESR